MASVTTFDTTVVTTLLEFNSQSTFKSSHIKVFALATQGPSHHEG